MTVSPSPTKKQAAAEEQEEEEEEESQRSGSLHSCFLTFCNTNMVGRSGRASSSHCISMQPAALVLLLLLLLLSFLFAPQPQLLQAQAAAEADQVNSAYDHRGGHHGRNVGHHGPNKGHHPFPHRPRTGTTPKPPAAPGGGGAGLRQSQCAGACSYRCSKAFTNKACNFFCNKCCNKCLCVPPGTYGNKEVCPCYNNWKTQQGGPKCP